MPKEPCFVIMPFSKTSDQHTEEYWTKHFESFLKSIIEENANLEARRSTPLRGDVLRDIITNLVTSKILIADLTDKNANVYWELGVRQSFKHGTITIAEEGTILPFDISVKSTLFYSSDRVKNEGFRKKFKQAIDDCITNPKGFDSHVLEAISGRGSLHEIIVRHEILRKIDALLSEFDFNLSVVKMAVSESDQNSKRPKENQVFPSLRLRHSAIELFTTTCYLDAEKPIYQLAENCFNWIVAIDSQLDRWSQSRESVEKWLTTNIPLGVPILNNFMESLAASKKQLKERN